MIWKLYCILLVIVATLTAVMVELIINNNEVLAALIFVVNCLVMVTFKAKIQDIAKQRERSHDKPHSSE